MGATLVTPPSIEPIDIQEARDHLRVVSDDEDTLIEALIKVARELAEVQSGRCFISQTWRATYNEFPGFPVSPSLWSNSVASRADRVGFDLPRSPVISVSSVKYTDEAGVEQTMPSTDYTLISDEAAARVILAYGKSWPTARDEENAVRIQFVAGYGSNKENVPSVFRHAIKLILGHYFENREPYITGTIVAEIPWAAKALLASKGVVQIK